MKRLRSAVTSVFVLCMLGGACDAQTGKAPPNGVSWSIAPVAPTAPVTPKKKSAAAQPASVSALDSDKAARLAEGRKKFFEQSTGFDNSTMWDKTNMNVGGGGASSKPSVGFSF